MLVEVLRSAKPERVEADVQVGDNSCNTAAIPRIQVMQIVRGNKKNNGTRINLCAMKTVNNVNGISYSHGGITQRSTCLWFLTEWRITVKTGF